LSQCLGTIVEAVIKQLLGAKQYNIVNTTTLLVKADKPF